MVNFEKIYGVTRSNFEKISGVTLTFKKCTVSKQISLCLALSRINANANVQVLNYTFVVSKPDLVSNNLNRNTKLLAHQFFD